MGICNNLVTVHVQCGFHTGAMPAIADDVSPVVMAEINYFAEAVRNHGGGLRHGFDMRQQAIRVLR